jgi:glycosyltransferase involved in cell wall biosynthesis
MLILQGSGINKDRGAEEAVAMMQYLEGFILVIVGSGDVIEDLKKMIKNLNIQDKVLIIGKIPYKKLLEYTKIADLGLSLDKGTNLNYEYSLPNKVFDYIQCHVPLLVSNRRVVAKLVLDNEIGLVFDKHDPKEMADIVKSIFADKKRLEKWQKNLKIVAEKYNWENESKKLKNIYSQIK